MNSYKNLHSRLYSDKWIYAEFVSENPKLQNAFIMTVLVLVKRVTMTHKDEDCIACGQKQEIQCPICLDMHSSNYVKVFKCGHITCWKCYSNAFEANKAIKKCPLCRKNI